MTVRKALLAVALSLGLAAMAGPVALAGHDAEPTVCPTSATFPILLPPIPELGLGGGIGVIVTSEHPTGKKGQCAGTFVVLIGSQQIQIASGTLLAKHRDTQVFAIFSGTLVGGVGTFTGSLRFNGSTGTVTVEITTAAGCLSVTVPFTATSSGFLPGTPTFGSCGENEQGEGDGDDDD